MSQASAPRDQDQPFCPEGDFRFWAGVGGGATVVLSLAYLVGLVPLFPNAGAEGIGILARISGLLSNLVWLALCTGAGSLAFSAVALVHGRRPGSAVDIVGRAFACIAVANLVHMVPWQGDVLKAIVDVAAFLLSVTLLSRAAFRVRLLDAAAAVALAFGAVAALAAVAYAIVWAVLPK